MLILGPALSGTIVKNMGFNWYIIIIFGYVIVIIYYCPKVINRANWEYHQ